VASTDSALARLVGDEQAFVRDDFGRRPRHLEAADRDGFVDLLSLDDVDHIIAATALRAPAFRLVRQGVTLPTSRVTRSARVGSRPIADLVDVAAVHREFAAGATIVLQGLHRSWSPVATLCRSLEASLTHRVQANAYLTPPVAQGLNLHGDPHDVFAVQTHGVKRWVVEPPGETRWELELRPGDVLYLPAGTRHAAQTIDQPSLHLTVGVRPTTWRDVVDRAVAQALGSVAELDGLDEPLPAGWAHDAGALATRLHDHLGAVASALQADGSAERAADQTADRFWSTRPPDRSGGLRDLLEVDHLDDATPLRVRPDASCRVRVDGDQVTLVLGDRRLTMPARLEPVLRRILDLEMFAPKELDELIDAASRQVLCRRLVREGLLTIDRRPASVRA
jgi:bifunctional lysine-specific demethylase and histidyl-hydroxylase NO66